MDIHDTLQEAISLLEDARPRAFGAGAVVDRDRLLELLVSVRQSMPAEIVAAAEVLAQRDDIVSGAHKEAEHIRAGAQQEAEQIRAHAEQERDYLVAEHTVLGEAQSRADEITRRAHERVGAMRAEVDDYVDAKLGSLAATLSRTLDMVQEGRQRARGGQQQPEQVVDVT